MRWADLSDLTSTLTSPARSPDPASMRRGASGATVSARSQVGRGSPRGGFSLLEISAVLAMIAIVTASVLPLVLGRAQQEAAHAAARDMAAILDAAKNFYASRPVNDLRWPSGLDELRASGFIPQSFSAVTPFNTPYAAAPDSSGSFFTVRAEFPGTLAAGIARQLPLSTTTTAAAGEIVAGSVPVPGLSADLTQVLHRGGTTQNSTMYGPLQIVDGTQADGRVLVSDADGVGRWTNFLPGAVVFFRAEGCPPGWSELIEARGRYVVGVPPGGTLMAQVGTPLSDQENRAVGRHAHTITDPGHAHGVAIPTGRFSSTRGPAVAFSNSPQPTSTGVTSESATSGVIVNPSGSVDGTSAPYLQLLACQKD